MLKYSWKIIEANNLLTIDVFEGNGSNKKILFYFILWLLLNSDPHCIPVVGENALKAVSQTARNSKEVAVKFVTHGLYRIIYCLKEIKELRLNKKT